MTERTAKEAAQVAQNMADRCFPRTVYEEKCRYCGKKTGQRHGPGCQPRKSSIVAWLNGHKFQGWDHYVQTKKEIVGKCQKQGCDTKAQMRIGLNIWGVIHEFNVCFEHGLREDGTSRDGAWCDGL